MWNIVILLPIFFFVFFISILAEINSSPIDLVEGKLELVFGFNVKYFDAEFVLIFIAEYGMIIFFCYIILLIFRYLMHSWLFIVRLGILIIIIIYIRGILPRVPYDELIFMCWKIMSPSVLSYLFVIFSLKFFLTIN